MKGTKQLLITMVAVAGLASPVLAAHQSTTRASSTAQINQGSQLGQLARANTLIGKSVTTSDGKSIGNLQNIVMDLESGRVLYAVIQGQSGKSVAVPPMLFTNVRGDSLQLNATLEQLRSAPTANFSGASSQQLGQASFISQVYKHFGQNEWWQGSTPSDQGSFKNVHHAKNLVGMNVKDVSNKPIGEVKNVVVDMPAGRVTYVIFEPSRNMDLGNNLFALPPDALTLGQDGKTLVSNLDKAKLASAPHFSNDKWPNIASPAYASQVYRYYGKQAYFESGGALSPTGRFEDSSQNQGQGWNEDQGNADQGDWRNRHRGWHQENPRPDNRDQGSSRDNGF